MAQAVKHLPSSAFSTEDRLRLRAHVAALQKDQEAASRAIDALLAEAPSDTWALEHAAELASRSEDRSKVAALRERKDEVDHLRDEYRILMGDERTSSDAQHLSESTETLARTAEALGLRFEARGWWTLTANRPGQFSRDAMLAVMRLEQDQNTSRADREIIARRPPGRPAPRDSQA